MSALANTPVTPVFGGLRAQLPDALLSLIKLHRDDPRPHKLDLGVGVYRDEQGATPVLRAVKAAEAQLLGGQATKTYLGTEGDLDFLERLKPVVFGPLADAPLFAIQTPGGTGAVRLAAELLYAARPGARIFMGTPTWPNHPQIFAMTGLTASPYRYFDADAQRVRFDEMMDTLGTARAGDAILLHGCCHNPTGADLSLEQWREIADLIARRGLVPLIDLAYQGLGGGLEEDVAGLRLVLEAAQDALVAYSCDKNFGLYRERTGALFVLSRDAARMDLIQSNLKALARANWSMPPDHGAAVVRVILESGELSALWRTELEEMRQRIVAVRRALAGAAPSLQGLQDLHGMFAQLPLRPWQIGRMRSEHAVYLADSGRINILGLTDATVPAFARAYESCLFEEKA